MTMTDDPHDLDELLSRYLDGDATERERARIESDPALSARIAHMRDAIDLVGAAVDVPTFDLERIRSLAVTQRPTPTAVTDMTEARRQRGRLTRSRLLAAAAAFVLLAVAVTGLGFVLAWLMDSAAGYHGIMMLFLMPMLLLSGAFFPIEQAHWLISWIRHVNPMTYGLGALRHALHGAAPGCPSFMVCMVGTVVFAVATFLLGTYVVTRRSARDAA